MRKNKQRRAHHLCFRLYKKNRGFSVNAPLKEYTLGLLWGPPCLPLRLCTQRNLEYDDLFLFRHGMRDQGLLFLVAAQDRTKSRTRGFFRRRSPVFTGLIRPGLSRGSFPLSKGPFDLPELCGKVRHLRWLSLPGLGISRSHLSYPNTRGTQRRKTHDRYG